MTTDELRESYLSFFEKKGCIRRPSDLLVPANDPSVLFTPAGMNQFKEQFLGIGPLDYTRATSCQKCIRTGDIENVGKTRFHLTFFEMLGNFSFGDYFKRDAIHWAWEYCTKELKIPGERINVTIYLDDEEAFKIWHEEVKIPTSRIRRCDEDQNFWPASAPSEGPNGVCGPCSELYVDLGNGDEVEIWNLVFTQFNRTGFRELAPLPSKNIDTGMGLERAASVLQGVPTAFDIDNLRAIVLAGSELLDRKYDSTDPESYRLRRIADHSRTVTFCLHEGVHPSNEKQGYVVRRLLRRAVLDAYQLGCREPVLYRLVPAVVGAMRKAYPEIVETASNVSRAIKTEEERFLATVETGMNYLEGLIGRVERGMAKNISGADAFKLHATYGFPIELTEDLSLARRVPVDRVGFETEMESHRKTSGSGSFSGEVFHIGPIQELKKSVAPTQFLGYSELACDATIQAIIVGEESVLSVSADSSPVHVTLVLDRTPFYGESGGQVGDTGTIENAGGVFEVSDTQKTDGYHQHIGKVRKGTFRVGESVRAQVDGLRRAGIQRAHSATHLLHWALHQVLGKHAMQAGSKVEEDVLRFDFSHSQALSPSEIEKIERLANERIMEAAEVRAEVKPIAQARQEGAMALFGEKYGDEVRVVSMGDFSKEFCGGCHLSNTGQAGLLKILREESVAAGTRRITATTGLGTLRQLREQTSLLSSLAADLKAKPEEIPQRLAAIQREIKDLQKSLDHERRKQSAGQAGELVSGATVIDGVKVIVTEIQVSDAKQLQAQVDELMNKGGSLAVLLAARNNGKVDVVGAVSNDLVKRGLDASLWVREFAQLMGGKGGGRPQLARGGAPDAARLPEALAAAAETARKRLSKT